MNFFFLQILDSIHIVDGGKPIWDISNVVEVILATDVQV